MTNLDHFMLWLSIAYLCYCIYKWFINLPVPPGVQGKVPWDGKNRPPAPKGSGMRHGYSINIVREESDA
jgi:hypothetical protein